jgi:hypothetical protein
LQKVIGQLQTDTSLPSSERAALVGKLQDRLRLCKDLAAKLPQGGPALGKLPGPGQTKKPGNDPMPPPGSGGDLTNIRVKPVNGFVNQVTGATITGSGTVNVPDGGSRVLGSFSSLSEARNEAGVPLVGKVPYLDRGYRNVGFGRSVSNAQISVGVRIIILEEEAAKLTGNK